MTKEQYDIAAKAFTVAIDAIDAELDESKDYRYDVYLTHLKKARGLLYQASVFFKFYEKAVQVDSIRARISSKLSEWKRLKHNILR